MLHDLISGILGVHLRDKLASGARLGNSKAEIFPPLPRPVNYIAFYLNRFCFPAFIHL